MKQRLDLLVYERGLTPSRERARTSIMSGLVFVNGQRIDKPGTSVDSESEIELRGSELRYVSRGGLKLEHALDEFGIEPEGLACIDCGASTGGFTDCLLQRGARTVYAVDVGYGQLAWSLRSDPRVVVVERTNIRYAAPEDFPLRFELAVMDLSFISLSLVLPTVRELLCKPDGDYGGGEIVCLVKPQFEAGRDRVGKRGVVRDPAVHIDVLTAFSDAAQRFGFAVAALTFSPIRGPEGNIEYLAHLRLDPGGLAPAFDAGIILATVESAHSAL